MHRHELNGEHVSACLRPVARHIPALVVVVTPQHEHRKLPVAPAWRGASTHLFTEALEKAQDRVLDLVFARHLKGVQNWAMSRCLGGDVLRYLGGVLGHEVAGHVAQGLRAAEGLLQPQHDPLPTP
ncbi:hypothetical protein CATMIT_01972, partial [Catenibacterium mitsuokai DSM 15897]